MSELILEDIITVIVPFLPINDRLRFIRISTTWFRAIHSLQNMWRDNVLIGFLRIDDNTGMDQAIKEYMDHRQYMTKEKVYSNHIDWLKMVQYQFSKLPKKNQVGSANDDKELVMKKLNESHYGNVNLINEWKSPFKTENRYKTIEFPAQASLYEFQFNVREELERLGEECGKEKLFGIYSCCLLYELLSIGDYVPNLFSDLVKIVPLPNLQGVSLHNFVMSESFASVLLCVLQKDFSDVFKKWFLKDFSAIAKPNETIYEREYHETEYHASSETTVDDVMESVKEDGFRNFQLIPNISVDNFEWLPLTSFEDTILNLDIDDDLVGNLVYMDDSMYPMYYNAGGGYYDVLDVSFCIEPDGKTIKITRRESRSFY